MVPGLWMLIQAGCTGDMTLQEFLGDTGTPSATAASPLTGSAAGGTEVTIQGTNFAHSTGVLFGDTAAAEVRFVNAGVLVAITPAHTAGTVPITLVGSDAVQVPTDFSFIYQVAPAEQVAPFALSKVQPAKGPTSGGTKVTISGSNLESGMVVLFGGFLGTSVECNDSQTLSAVAPAQGAGTVDIAVRRGDGRTEILSQAFTYQGAEVSSVAPASGPVTGGTSVTLTGSGFEAGSAVLFGGVAGTSVKVLNSSTITVATPVHAAGSVDVTLVCPDGMKVNAAAKFEFQSVETTSADPYPGGPRLVSAISTSNTTVQVTFNEPVGQGADITTNYQIMSTTVNPQAGVLLVTGVVVSSDGLTVVLTTRSQSELDYELTVSNIKDLYGNPLASPTLMLDPTKTTFTGKPAAGGGLDTDGDGLSDADEQRGWVVMVMLANGQSVTREVTSDPTVADTDGDGLNDALEKSICADPRLRDTDADMLTDAQEWFEWRSDPTKQDSDQDGFSDSLEVLTFHTSPVIADTDGDQISDADEILRRNRNPLIADLPMPQILVDEFRLSLKVTSSYVDEKGQTHESTRSSQSSFTQSRSDTLGRSDTSSTQAENTYGEKVGGEFGYSTKDGYMGKITAESSFGQKRAHGFSSTTSTEQANVSQQEYQQSMQDALQTSERRAVTRTINEASIQASVNLSNQSDIAFTIQNIEISMQQQDRRSGQGFRPIATLRASSQLESLPAFQ